MSTLLIALSIVVLSGCTIDIWPTGPSARATTPLRPTGATVVYGYPGYRYSYTTAATDPEGGKLAYQFSMNSVVFPDNDNWSLYFPSGDTVVFTTDFAGFGSAAFVRARVKDMRGNISAWSEPLTVQIRFLAEPDTSTLRHKISPPAFREYGARGSMPLP